MINTVIFDFDGTIMNTNIVIIESWKHTYRQIYGKEMEVSEIVKTFGEPIAVSMSKVFPHIEPEESCRIYREFQEAHKDKMVKLFPRMDDLMKEVKERGYKTSIVTSRLGESLHEYLQQFRLLDYVDVIVTGNDSKAHKPDPEPILIALEKLGSKPEESIMIGDSMFDILCAKNAGCHSALVGWAEAVSYEDSGADYHLEEPEDLFMFLK